MEKPTCIFIHGQSIFIQAIVAGLREQANISLQPFNPHHPLAGTLLRQARPALLVIEVGGSEDWLMGDLLAADTPILVVNIENGRSKLLTGEPLPIAQPDSHGIGRLMELVNQIEVTYPITI